MANTPNKVQQNQELPETTQSKALLERARKRMPSVTQTLAKGPTQYVEGVAPAFLAKGEGARVWDVDGNEYIDFNMGIGPIILGYQYPKVDEAIQAQLKSGITFSLIHPLEVEVAELVNEVIPNAEMVRFSKTGADVTSAAIRAARAFTKRDKVLCCGYHGWHDWYIGTTPRNHGVPSAVSNLIQSFNYNDIESLEKKINNETACVIMEPMLFEQPSNEFLFQVKSLCEKHGALLIFDEMWTGFRLGLGGAQQVFDVKADLATFSKALANGMPLSMITGRADVMKVFDEEVFFYTTFGGEALSLAAAKATIEEIRDKNVCQVIENRGRRLRDGINTLAEKYEIDFLKCMGFGCRSMSAFASSTENPLTLKSYFQQELIRWGILWSGSQVISFSHTDADIEHFLSAADAILPEMKERVEQGKLAEAIRGKLIQPVFRTTTGKDSK